VSVGRVTMAGRGAGPGRFATENHLILSRIILDKKILAGGRIELVSWSDSRRWSVDKCLARIVQLEAAKARIEARQAELLARLLGNPDPICENLIPTNPKVNRAEIEQLSITVEVACALHLSHETAHDRMRTAHRLVHDLPDMLGLIRAGDVPYGHGVQLVRSTKDLDQPIVHKVEQATLQRSAGCVISPTRTAWPGCRPT
jgi:hypothetical protein